MPLIICIIKILFIGNLTKFIIYCSFRDLKPENILLESPDLNKTNIKITDFGFACFFKPEEGKKEILGSALYMAPEIIEGKTYDQRVDIWSIGVIAYILITGRAPFNGGTKEKVLQSIKQTPLNFELPIWR